MIKRVFLFLITNILIIATISIITSVLGVNYYIQDRGLNLTSLLFFCLIWGMGGAFISLALSGVLAKWMMKVQLIQGNPAGRAMDIMLIVKKLTQAAGLKMPKVGIYDSTEVNAFATGPTKNRALVAVSTGLLNKMNNDELEGVLAHEITHISNGDMVTMTLIAGVVNAFSLFLSRIIAFGVSTLVSDKLENIVRFATTIALDILFSILGSVVVAYFSRIREFKADAGAAKLSGRERMISALEKIKSTLELPMDDRAPSLATMKISGRRKAVSWFSTHPDINDRIDALRKMSI
jgi:heat shock protein HtpX